METLQLKNVIRKAFLAVLAVVIVPAFVFANDNDKEKIKLRVSKTKAPAEGYEPIDMFEGMENGSIKVKFIGLSSAKANVFVENVSDKPLAVEMPEVFAGVPVLEQGGFAAGGAGGAIGGGGQGGFGGGQGGTGGRNQGVGGGFGGGGGRGGGFGGGGLGGGGLGGGGFGGGGGIFNIPPGKKGKVQVATVCLEHGKLDPRPAVEYQIVPIEKMTTDTTVIEICKTLGEGRVDQLTAQAAAWNAANGLSWLEMAAKNRVKLSNGYTEKYFGRQHIVGGQRLLVYAKQRAEYMKELQKKSDSGSFSDITNEEIK